MPEILRAEWFDIQPDNKDKLWQWLHSFFLNCIQSQSGINYLNRVLPDGDSQSPVKNVDKIKVPVFIIQGEEDVRVPKEHAFALREELEKRNKPYEWMMKSGEAHGFYKEENNVERWTAMIEFFDKHTAK